MTFNRLLDERFVKRLNTIYGYGNSWWRAMVEDEDTFILIRDNNELRILVYGERLLSFTMDTVGFPISSTHVCLQSGKNLNSPLRVNERLPIKGGQELNLFAEHYKHAKCNIELFLKNGKRKEKEERVAQSLAVRNCQFIDLEVGLEREPKSNESRKSSELIDMAAISENGVVVFFEAKLFDNPDIRSRPDKTPKVVDQLKGYKSLLEKHRTEIVKAYEQQLGIYTNLEGRFFKRRRGLKMVKPTPYPEVRLIITEFDGSPQRCLLPKIQKQIMEGMGWEEESHDLIAVDNQTNIKMEKLFEGIR